MKRYLPVVLALFHAAPASATILNLQCTVRESHTDGAVYNRHLRYDFNFDTSVYREYFYKSGQWQHFGTRTIKRADSTEILTHNSNTEYERIDRTTGDFYFKDSRTGMVQRGKCEKVESLPRKF